MVRLVTRGEFSLPKEVQYVCLHTPDAVDVRLRCKDHKAADGLGAHQLLLASASPNFLKNIFLSNQDDMICVHLPNYNAEDVSAVVSLLYYGELIFYDIVTLDICQQIMRDLGICVSVTYDYEDNLYKLINSIPLSEKSSINFSTVRVVKHEMETTHECDRCSFVTTDYNAFTHHVNFCPCMTSEFKVETNPMTDNEALINLNENNSSYVLKAFHCSYPSCQFSTDSLSDYQVHIIVHNRKETLRSCPVCFIPTSSPSKLRQHFLALHSNIKSCTECKWRPTEDNDFESLLNHIQTHRSGTSLSLHCEYCDYSCTSSSHLSRHLKVHNNEKEFTCSDCPAKFRVRHQLNLHQNSIHLKKRLHNCHSCSKSYSTSKQLKSHFRTKSCEFFQCKMCNKHFKKSQSLAGHVKSAHPEIRHPKTQICEACGKSFSKKSGLRNHKCGFNDSSKVEEEKRCDICDKMVSISSYKSHTQYHLSGKKTCHHCKKVFANKSSLERHKLIHFNIKSFQCDTCLKEFSQNSALLTHKRVHTGERSTCSNCGKRFISKSLLNHHYRVTKCSKTDD
uniref:Zinc finger protein 135like [Alligator mississippiensis] n=2 Tax=Lepeophtheirus salmonis TaxID=72036 RepID=A0A0K2U6W7_LEPSM